MATKRTITLDMDAREHDRFVDELRRLAELFDQLNIGKQVELLHDPETVVVGLRDLADALMIYFERILA
jgi:hypothetical protein